MKSYAVLVGTNKFKNFPTHTLSFCESDVNSLKRILHLNENLKDQFEKGEIVSITGADFTRDQVYETISETFSKATSEDQVWLFIASHGYARNNENFIYTHNAASGSDAVKDTSCLNLGELRGLLSESKAGKKFVFIDCCHASSVNFIHRDAGEELFSFRRARSDFSERTFAFFNSSSEGELSYECEKLKQGVWSHFLGQALSGEHRAWKNGTTLTVDSLQSYLSKNVSEYSRKIFDAKQTPDIELKGTGGETVIAHIRKDSVFEAEFEKNCKLSKEVISRIDQELFPILEELDRTATVDVIREQRDKWERLVVQKEEVPVAMIGMVGSGKTTLLNAVTECQIGLAGEGSAKSAAILIVRRSEDEPTIVVNYIKLEEIQGVVDEILAIEEDDFGYFPEGDEAALSDSQLLELSELLIDPTRISGQKIKLDDLRPEIRSKIQSGLEVIKPETTDIMEISDIVRDFSDSNGSFWRITRSIEVTGPFPGLEPGMTIMDLPGFGDLDALRIRRAKEALEEVHQVIVVTGGRGIYDDIRNTLKQVGLMTSILMNPRLEQIIFVGTKIDAGRVSISDQVELELADDYEPKDAVKAQFNQWRESTSKQWKNLVEIELKRARTSHHVPAEEIHQNTKFVPISPDGYLCLSGLQRDPTGIYQKCFAEDDSDFAATTGISEIRQTIRRLLLDQKRLKYEKMLSESANLASSLGSACNDLKTSLINEIELSENENNLVSQFLLSVGGCVANDYFEREKVDSIETIVFKFYETLLPQLKERWGGLKATTIAKTLFENFGKLQYNTLAASLRRKGKFSSKGKDKISINIPEKIDYAVRQILVSTANWKIFPEIEAKLSQRVSDATETYCNDLKVCLSNLKSGGFHSSDFLGEVDSIVSQFEENTRKVQIGLSERMNALRDRSPAISQEAVGLAFGPVLIEALGRVEGQGARKRIIEEIARNSEASIDEICSRAARGFCKLIQDEVEIEFNEVRSNVQRYIEHTFRRLEESHLKNGRELGVPERMAFLGRVRAFEASMVSLQF